MKNNYAGVERRECERYDFEKPFQYREVTSSGKEKSLSSVIKGVVKNLSASGLLFVINSKNIPNIASLLLLELEYYSAAICRELEERSLIAQNIFLGKVVRIESNADGTSDVGVALVPRQSELTSDIETLIGE
ncbi:MAG: PilZ domain-containing protein [Candidatus Omnitrophica bacterium]|nr:PilZ domain-containing protein [Candidatus Omnitrophota bacterium]